MKSGGAAAARGEGQSRVPEIPSNVKKMIGNIQEIADHSEEEIHAMLKECNMDPNETVQRLLLQDPFREVKRKRDKKKENHGNKEPLEPRGRSGAQGRGNKGVHATYAPRQASHDTGNKDNVINQAAEKPTAASRPNLQEPSKKELIASSSVAVVANGPPTVASGSTKFKSTTSSSTIVSKRNPAVVSVSENAPVQPNPTSSDRSVYNAPSSASAVCFSSSDPVLLPSDEMRAPGTIGAIKREVGSQRASVKSNAKATISNMSSVKKSANPLTKEEMPEKSPGVAKSQFLDSSRPQSTSSHGSSLGSRPSSSQNNRAQQVGTQRVNSIKEWKPKTTNTSVAQGSVSAGSSALAVLPLDTVNQPQPIPSVPNPGDETSKVQKKLEELQLPQRLHVILPSHIRVPESERLRLTFGSFGVDSQVPSNIITVPDNGKSPTPQSNSSQLIEENVEEQSLSNQNAPTIAEEDKYADNSQSLAHAQETLPSGEGDISSGPAHDYDEQKESGLLSGGTQYPMVNASPNYNLGFVPPMFGTQLGASENSESQARDASRIPNFSPPIDPTSYYSQYYRADAEGEGHISPIPAAGDAAKYNGNIAGFPVQTSQSEEGGNALVLSTAAPAPHMTQATALMQSSIPVTQQPMPIFRPPAGMPMSHFPANYLHYGHYLPPFYVAPPNMHPFMGNSAFAPQPQAGGVYPAPPGAAAAGVKYPFTQFRLGTNAGNSTYMGVPSAYGPYGASTSNYNLNSATTGNPTSSEDLSASQFNENNVYVTGQQNDGSAMWIPAPTRDSPNLPSGPYYNVPTHGNQHVALTPAQAGHGSFASLYHPAQAVTTAPIHHTLAQQSQPGMDMVGAAGGVYQQHGQSNWPNSFH